MNETSVQRQRKKPRKVHAVAAANNFSAAYFRKFYLNPATQVVTAAEMRSRAALIAAILKQCQIPVRSILDAGCGIGLLRKPFEEILPRARYAGLEASPYLCKRFAGGYARVHHRISVPRTPIWSGHCPTCCVLPDAEAARAISNLARLARSALYVSALTTADWRRGLRLRDRNRSRRAPAIRIMVSAAIAAVLSLRRFRYLAAQKRNGDSLGHGAGARPQRLPRIHATNAACTGSAARVVCARVEVTS